MLNWANQFSKVVRAIGLMLIAAAFVLTPYGSSSSAMASPSAHASVHQASSNADTAHDMHRDAKAGETGSQAADSGHDKDSPDHKRDTCCEGFCVGSAALSSSTTCLVHPTLARNPFGRHASLEPGEWVPPFRPPSSLI